MMRLVVTPIIVQRVPCAQRTEAPLEVVDEGPGEEGLHPAGAYPLPPVNIVVNGGGSLAVGEVGFLT
jgi:hypothetical protein